MPKMRITEKNILITGTSGGIGKALAKHYLAMGNKVIGCSRKKSSLSELNYTHRLLDISNEKDVIKFFSFIRKEYSQLDVLINNAGIASMNHSLLTPIKTVEKILKTNIMGTFLFSREAAKIMKKNQTGRIINFSSIATPLKLEGESVYASSKAAINSLTETLSKEFAPFGITVNCIGPTPIKTNLIKSIPKVKIDDLIKRQAIKRFGEFSDISNVTDFFIRPESEFITGQVIYLGGV